jgi:hypothetical protein
VARAKDQDMNGFQQFLNIRKEFQTVVNGFSCRLLGNQVLLIIVSDRKAAFAWL